MTHRRVYSVSLGGASGLLLHFLPTGFYTAALLEFSDWSEVCLSLMNPPSTESDHRSMKMDPEWWPC